MLTFGFRYGAMPFDVSDASMRPFASEVIPTIRRGDASVTQSAA